MRRVNLAGRALARYSDRPNLEWQFAVLDSDTVNAFPRRAGLVLHYARTLRAGGQR